MSSPIGGNPIGLSCFVEDLNEIRPLRVPRNRKALLAVAASQDHRRRPESLDPQHARQSAGGLQHPGRELVAEGQHGVLPLGAKNTVSIMNASESKENSAMTSSATESDVPNTVSSVRAGQRMIWRKAMTVS